MLIFSTTSNLRHFVAANTIFCDGTFYTCPSLFHQLYTIHAMIDGSMYPLVFGLLPGKDQTNYIRFFSHIKDLSRQQNIHLQPQTVFIDYEIATNNAATTVFRFPRGDHQGVFLPLHTMHLAQDSKVWTTDLLQRKRRHYQTGSTSSCIVPSTTERSRRRLVQRPTRHWRRRQRS